MEHPCPRCGSAVDDSSPFCGNCGAPQIRFSGIENSPHNVKVGATAATAIIPVEIEPTVTISTPRSRKGEFRAAIISGAIAGLLSLLPLGLFLGAPLGGFLAVVVYRRSSLTDDPTPRSGFRLGALSGLCGFVIFALIFTAQIVFSHGENELRSGMIDAIHRQQSRNPDPQARQLLEYFLTPQGLTIMMIGGLVFVAIVFVVLSGLGGMVSAVLLKRKDGASR